MTFFDDTFPYFKDFVNRDIEISEDHVVITFPSLPVAPALNVEQEIPNSGGNADQNENPASHAEKVEENLSTPTSSSPTPTPTTPTPPSTDENPKEDDLTLPSTDESPEEDESQPPNIDIPDTNDQAEEAEPKPGGVFIPTGNPKYHQAKFFDDFDKLGDERERRRNAVKLSTTESEYYAISEGMRVVVWMKNSVCGVEEEPVRHHDKVIWSLPLSCSIERSDIDEIQGSGGMLTNGCNLTELQPMFD